MKKILLILILFSSQTALAIEYQFLPFGRLSTIPYPYFSDVSIRDEADDLFSVQMSGLTWSIRPQAMFVYQYGGGLAERDDIGGTIVSYGYEEIMDEEPHHFCVQSADGFIAPAVQMYRTIGLCEGIVDYDEEGEPVFYVIPWHTGFSLSDWDELDLISTLTHEMGHLLGLDHPCDPYESTPSPSCDDLSEEDLALVVESTMHFMGEAGSTNRRSLNDYDIGAIRALYGYGRESDGDGIVNRYDNCRDISNVDQDDLDGDGRGDLCDVDIDGDGIPNNRDPRLAIVRNPFDPLTGRRH